MNRLTYHFTAVISISFVLVFPGHAEERVNGIAPANDAPRPLEPMASAARIRLPEGFRIELVASEPLVQEPSCIAFDDRGRIFVSELHGYNIEGQIDVRELNKTGVLDRSVRRIRWELTGGPIADEAAKRQFGVLKLLVDSDGDGVVDRSHLWADDLPPCYGVIPARGGVIVTCAPDIVFFADRDGDGEVDVRETLFTGFQRRVMERGINNPRWGLDNWIYVGGGGEGGTITGPRLKQPVRLGNSDFRIKPDGSAIEPVHGRVGTFGLTINDVGDRFPASGGQPAIYALPLPRRYLARNPWVPTPETNHAAVQYNRGFRISEPHPWRVQRQQDPEWVKFYGARETNSNYFSGGCSNEFYGDVLFPEPYRGNLFYCEPSLNIIHRCVLERDGPGYRGRRAESEQESEFLASTDQWFRPMNLRVGPDGALYIVDMYREIIEDYSAIPRFLQQQYGLDKGGDRGRIWRLLPESSVDEAGARRANADLSRQSNESLTEVLSSPSPWRRTTAQRLLVEREATMVSDRIAAIIGAHAPPYACIHSLYTLDGLGTLREPDVMRGLDHHDHRVRIHALRLSESWLDSSQPVRDKVFAMVDDDDPSVRLQVAMSVGESRDASIVKPLASLSVAHGRKRWMDAAILSSSRSCAEELLGVLLRQTDSIENWRPLLRPLSATVAGKRDAEAIAHVLRIVSACDDDLQAECLTGLLDGASRGTEPMPPSRDGFAALVGLLASESDELRELSTRLAALLPIADRKQLQAVFQRAAEEAVDENRDLSQRLRAVEVLSSAPADQLLAIVDSLLHPRELLALQLSAVRSLGSSRDPRAAETLLRRWPSLSPTLREAAMQVIFARVDRHAALLDAIEAGIVSPAEISEMRREQLVSQLDVDVARRANALLAAPETDDALQARIGRYGDALAGPRDVVVGRQLFEKHCLACHRLGERGYAVGPHLGSIVAKPDEAILADLLDPSSRIEPEYRSYSIVTRDGRSFSGVMVSESSTSVTLGKEKGARDTLLREDIEQVKASSVSLMPSNFHEQINPQQAASLVAFLRTAYRSPSSTD